MRNRFACMQLGNWQMMKAFLLQVGSFPSSSAGCTYNDQLPSVSNIIIPLRIRAHDLNGEQDQSKLMQLRCPLRGITYTER